MSSHTAPLAGGVLTGKYQPDKPFPEGSRGQLRPERISRNLTPHNLEILKVMEKISEETGMSMSQLSLAWLLANSAITSPIIGASKLEQLEENVEVVNHALPAEALKRISEVSKPDWLCEQEETAAHLRALEEQRRSYWKKRLEVKR